MRFYTATNGTQAVTLDGANLFFNSIANVTMHALTTGGGTIAFDGGLFHNDVLTGIRFNIGSGGGFDLDFITTLAVLCYCAGTSIATPDGPRAVETLAPGDMVRTAGGRDVPVKWLGKLPVDTRLGHPDAVNPIRITAGALGGGLPERDLRVSADHAIAIDGYLINAGALVNGQTIYQEAKMPMDGFTYYHIETEAHELLLAEGVAAESFIDYAGRAAFENGDESSASITEMNLPRISTARLVPDHIRARLIPKIAAE